MEKFDKSKFSFSKISPIVDLSEKERKLRENNISLFLKELFLYKVLLKDLISALPSLTDRNVILNLAFFIVQDFEMLEKFQKNRKLPINKLCKETGIKRVFIERWQDYLITYTIILANPNYKSLQDYFIIEYKGDSIGKNIENNEEPSVHKGLILKGKKRSAFILTSRGEFIRIKTDENKLIGDEVKGKEKIGFKHIKLKLAIVVFLIILIAIAGYRQYTKVASTIVVEGTSIIKIQTNAYNDVIYIYSPSDKGKELINSSSFINEDIDTALKSCIEYANKNEMIPTTGILITVTGDPIKYGTILKTEEYILDNNLKVQINNNGNQHKIIKTSDDSE